MIIKFIPENDVERASFKEEEHSGITEYFVFGQKKEADGQFVDFHSWRGNHRYLLGSMNYFYEIVNDERRSRAMSSMPFQQAPSSQNAPTQNFKLQKLEETPDQNVEVQASPAVIAEEITAEDPTTPEVLQMPEAGFDLDKKE